MSEARPSFNLAAAAKKIGFLLACRAMVVLSSVVLAAAACTTMAILPGFDPAVTGHLTSEHLRYLLEMGRDTTIGGAIIGSVCINMGFLATGKIKSGLMPGFMVMGAAAILSATLHAAPYNAIPREQPVPIERPTTDAFGKELNAPVPQRPVLARAVRAAPPPKTVDQGSGTPVPCGVFRNPDIVPVHCLG